MTPLPPISRGSPLLLVLLLLGALVAWSCPSAADAAVAGIFPEARLQLPDEKATTDLLTSIGGWAYVVAPLLMIAVAILPIPAELPAMANGMVFGAVIGTTITWLGAIVGALVSFELARHYGRPLAERFLKPKLVDRVDRVVQSAGWPGLMMLRLFPAVAFTAVNWGAGLTSVNRWTFVWTTVIGILPGAILFTVSGSGLLAVFRMNPVAGWGILLLVALVVWFTVARYRRRPLRSWTGEFASPARGKEVGSGERVAPPSAASVDP